jgi:hypothetical protein
MTTFPWPAGRAVRWGALVCLLGGVAVLGRTWDVPEPALPAAGQVEDASGDELEAERAAVLRRIEAKREAVEEVLAGRLAPGEAADLFRTFREDLRRRYLGSDVPIPPAPFEEDQLCREVMTYARDALRDRPDGAEEALARLEQELRAHLARRRLTPEGEEAGVRQGPGS